MVKTVTFIIVAVLIVVGATLYSRSDNFSNPSETQNTKEIVMEKVSIEDIVVGDGAEIKNGDIVSVHYVGTLTDSTKFDSSRDRGEPFEITVGAGQVIEGWEQGLPGMKVGGTRKLTVPPALAYGDKGVPDLQKGGFIIPPDSTLVFEIEALGIK